MTKSLKSLWARFLFQGKGVLPTKRLLLLFTLLSIALVIVSIWDISWTFLLTVNILVLIASLFDLLFSAKKKELSFKRMAPAEMERGITYQVQIEIKNNSPYSLSYRLIDGIPQSFIQQFPLKGNVSTQTTVLAAYEVIAPVRGEYEIDKIYFRYSSPLGLWEKQLTIEQSNAVKVIPDLTETKQYLENAQKFLLYEGVKIRKQQSGVGEFAKIRSYVVGDDPRNINWRQTAKLREVMTNEYEPEHGKHMTILIDCGRMMGAELKKGNRLEKSLEAAITVAAAALQKGDYVSVLAFSKDVKVFVPAAKGMAHLQTILQAIYNIEVDAAESNYAAVLHYLETMQKKRSFILLFSDVRTFLHEESALTYLKRMRQRHLFLMIGIEDMTIQKRIQMQPENVQMAMIKSIAQQQMLFKKKEKIKWEKQGLQMIEAREERLATAAVSSYIDIMNRNLL
ncbi:DUF58 domain-containing protein [Cytobacillus solani]|uniref:VWFA domain-containing protein n=1 Tax=Cytobacillus solani TaxID=1637975 RepID=A0A0Q3VHC3_9BACI|nr:DUF58 domain-containing protein [Cytobacillus solani]KQL19522.1 hypothetical protein AN957_13765 [Cytobacillus solani]USK52746.1 DUF58 domain-containing protein [Cytobacillus solani]